jgi:hypothetical protein
LIQQTIPVSADHEWHHAGLADRHARKLTGGGNRGAKKKSGRGNRRPQGRYGRRRQGRSKSSVKR